MVRGTYRGKIVTLQTVQVGRAAAENEVIKFI